MSLVTSRFVPASCFDPRGEVSRSFLPWPVLLWKMLLPGTPPCDWKKKLREQRSECLGIPEQRSFVLVLSKGRSRSITTPKGRVSDTVPYDVLGYRYITRGQLGAISVLNDVSGKAL